MSQYRLTVTIIYKGLKATKYFSKQSFEAVDKVKGDLQSLKFPLPKNDNVQFVSHGCMDAFWITTLDSPVHRVICTLLGLPRYGYRSQPGRVTRQDLNELSIQEIRFDKYPHFPEHHVALPPISFPQPSTFGPTQTVQAFQQSTPSFQYQYPVQAIPPQQGQLGNAVPSQSTSQNQKQSTISAQLPSAGPSTAVKRPAPQDDRNSGAHDPAKKRIRVLPAESIQPNPVLSAVPSADGVSKTGASPGPVANPESPNAVISSNPNVTSLAATAASESTDKKMPVNQGQAPTPNGQGSHSLRRAHTATATQHAQPTVRPSSTTSKVQGTRRPSLAAAAAPTTISQPQGVRALAHTQTSQSTQPQIQRSRSTTEPKPQTQPDQRQARSLSVNGPISRAPPSEPSALRGVAQTQRNHSQVLPSQQPKLPPKNAPVSQSPNPVSSTPQLQTQSSRSLGTAPAPSTATPQQPAQTSQSLRQRLNVITSPAQAPATLSPQQSQRRLPQTQVQTQNVALLTGAKRPYPFQSEMELHPSTGVSTSSIIIVGATETKRAKTDSLKNNLAQPPFSISLAPAAEISSNMRSPTVSKVPSAPSSPRTPLHPNNVNNLQSSTVPRPVNTRRPSGDQVNTPSTPVVSPQLGVITSPGKQKQVQQLDEQLVPEHKILKMSDLRKRAEKTFVDRQREITDKMREEQKRHAEVEQQLKNEQGRLGEELQKERRALVEREAELQKERKSRMEVEDILLRERQGLTTVEEELKAERKSRKETEERLQKSCAEAQKALENERQNRTVLESELQNNRRERLTIEAELQWEKKCRIEAEEKFKSEQAHRLEASKAASEDMANAVAQERLIQTGLQGDVERGKSRCAELERQLEDERKIRAELEEVQEVEKKRRVEAEDLLKDVERECRSPFVVPGMLEAFATISNVTSQVMKVNEP